MLTDRHSQQLAKIHYVIFPTDINIPSGTYSVHYNMNTTWVCCPLMSLKEIPDIPRWQQWQILCQWPGKLSSHNWLEEVTSSVSSKNCKQVTFKLEQSSTFFPIVEYQFLPREYHFHPATSIYTTQLCSLQFLGGNCRKMRHVWMDFNIQHKVKLIPIVNNAFNLMDAFKEQQLGWIGNSQG